MRVCVIEGCEVKAICKGMCNRHYHKIKAARKHKPCACGCGENTAYTYKHGHHTRLFTSEEQARRGRCNDGSKQRDRGCKDTYRKVGGRHEHRLVAEQMMERPLSHDEIVHHKNGNKKDNRLENLEVMTRAQHMHEHRADLNAGRARASQTRP